MYEQFKEILTNELNIDESIISTDARLKKDLGINSLELADLILMCEDKFEITIDDDNLSKFITVGDIVAFLESAK